MEYPNTSSLIMGVNHQQSLIIFIRFLFATLALGSWPRQGLAKVRAKKEAWESHLMLPRVEESVREWTLTLPSEFPLWELESWWTFESSDNNCRGQNPLDWKVHYVIGKILEFRCRKWACMTHLDTLNTSYGEKKGRESNCQFNSQPLKVGNCSYFLVCRWLATYRWKALDKGYNLF
jgi:hypothetical protein